MGLNYLQEVGKYHGFDDLGAGKEFSEQQHWYKTMKFRGSRTEVRENLQVIRSDNRSIMEFKRFLAVYFCIIWSVFIQLHFIQFMSSCLK